MKPIFEEGDVMVTIEEYRKGITDGLPFVVSIDERYYHCNNELIPISEQSNYVYPTRKVNS